MSFPTRRSIVAGPVLLVVVSVPVRAETVEVYRRAMPIEVRTGIVSVRAVHGALLDVPLDCDEGPLKCREGVRFPTLYAVSFALENRESSEAGPRVDLADRGTVYLALRFEAEDEVAFAAELREILSHLSADAFAERFAGLDDGEPPFASIRERSVEPSWTCLEDGSSRSVTRHRRVGKKLPDGTVAVSAVHTDTFQETALSWSLCDGMASVVASAHPEEIRTMPLPRVLRETTVRVQFEDGLLAEAYADDLVTLPQGASFTLKPVPGAGSGQSMSEATDGSFVKDSWRENGTERAAVTVPGEIPPDAVTRNAWLARFTVETSERRLGPLPTETVLDTETLVIALLPTFPAVLVDEDYRPRSTARREVYAIAFDAGAFLDEIARRLDRQVELDAATIEEAVVLRPAGLESEGWILAACRADGTAQYGVSSLRARSPVTNATLFCAAAESRIE